jgi:hypothetical protein
LLSPHLMHEVNLSLFKWYRVWACTGTAFSAPLLYRLIDFTAVMEWHLTLVRKILFHLVLSHAAPAGWEAESKSWVWRR